MKSREFLAKYEKQLHDEKTKDHSLRRHSFDRAEHLDTLHVGTPYDWEDLERYKEELARMDKEGPGAPHKKSD